MKNVIYLIAITLLTGLFYSCEKENFTPSDAAATATNTEKATIVAPQDSIVIGAAIEPDSVKGKGKLEKNSSTDPAGIHGTTLYIQSKFTNQYFDVTTNGNPELIQHLYDGTSSQAFRFRSAGDGSYYIQSAYNGKYLTAGHYSNVQFYSFHGGYEQRFYVSHRGDGYFSIQSKYSGKCVQIFPTSLYNQYFIGFNHCNGYHEQLFKLYYALKNVGTVYSNCHSSYEIKVNGKYGTCYLYANQSKWIELSGHTNTLYWYCGHSSCHYNSHYTFSWVYACRDQHGATTWKLYTPF